MGTSYPSHIKQEKNHGGTTLEGFRTLISISIIHYLPGINSFESLFLYFDKKELHPS
jgi:hypothetical protein